MADTVVTRRPNGTDFVGTSYGTVVGAADIWTATSDNSDASYGLGDAAVGDRLNVWFTGFGIPAYAIVKSVTFRARIAGSGGQYSMYGGTISDGKALLIDQTFSQVTPPVDVTGGAKPTRPWDGLPWTATDVGRLSLDVIPQPTGTVQLIEAYADIAYNQAPVATPTLPTGTINTSQPDLTWTYTDPENDPEDRWQVKVFAAATYGAVGFDPDTSTPAWDSDEIFTSATSVAVTAQLANNTTFKVYAKASDAGSSGRYGPWTAGPAFTTAVLNPAAPVVVSATPDPTLNRITIVVQGRDNELTRNQASSESGVLGFEADTNIATTTVVTDGATTNTSPNIASATAGFTTSDVGATITGTNIPALATIIAVTSPTAAVLSANATGTGTGITFTIASPWPKRSTAQFVEGASSFIMRSAAAGDMAIRTLAGTAAVMIPVVPSTQYTILASLRARTTTRNCRVDVYWYQADGTTPAATASNAGSNVSVTSAAFVAASVTATSPADAAYAVVKPRVLATVAGGEDFYVERLGLAPGTSLVWARGGLISSLSPAADTFDRADSALTMGSASASGGAWAPLGSVWGISSNQAYMVSAATGVSSVLTLPAMEDGTLTVDITMGPASTSDAGVVLRGKDNIHFLTVGLFKSSTTDTVYLAKVLGPSGTRTVLAQATAPGILNGRTYGLKVEFFGARIVASLDKKDGAGYIEVVDFTLSAADLAIFGGPTNKQYGLVLWQAGDLGCRWNNFAVSSSPSQLVMLERSTDGGTTWVVVRTANRVDLTDPGQTGTFYDYEAPRNTEMQYRARVQGSEIDLTVLSDYSAALTMTGMLTGDGQAWLKSPTDPTLSIPIRLIKDTAGSDSVEDLAVFTPLGRPDPLIHSGTIRSEYFPELGFMCLTDAEWVAFETLRRRQETLLLQTCYGDDTTISVPLEGIDGGDADGIPPATELVDAGGPSSIPTGFLDGGDPPDDVVILAPFDEFWIRLGPTRSVSRITMPPSPGQLRGIRIAAYEVAAPAVT